MSDEPDKMKNGDDINLYSITARTAFAGLVADAVIFLLLFVPALPENATILDFGSVKCLAAS